MSVSYVERASRRPTQDRTIELPTSIREKLHTVIRQNWRSEWVRRVALAAAIGLLAIIGLIVADILFSLRWTPLRWAIWLIGLGVTVGAVRYLGVRPRRRDEQLLDAAWKIESSHPAMEERLTSTVQFRRARLELKYVATIDRCFGGRDIGWHRLHRCRIDSHPIFADSRRRGCRTGNRSCLFRRSLASIDTDVIRQSGDSLVALRGSRSIGQHFSR